MAADEGDSSEDKQAEDKLQNEDKQAEDKLRDEEDKSAVDLIKDDFFNGHTEELPGLDEEGKR